MTKLEQELYQGLLAARAALRYAEKYFNITYSQAAEMWSFVNGYSGNPDIDDILDRATNKLHGSEELND